MDEEAERQRRRKKEGSKSGGGQTTLPPVKKPEAVPQIPKPRSSGSPKSTRSHPSATLDLLGLGERAASTNQSLSQPKTTTYYQSNNSPSKLTHDIYNANVVRLSRGKLFYYQTAEKSCFPFFSIDTPSGQSSANGSASGDDIFSSFLSAPPAPPSTSLNSAANGAAEATASAEKTEEESFFNQPAPTPQEKSKMTKDSILALYATPNQQQQSMFGVSGESFFTCNNYT